MDNEDAKILKRHKELYDALQKCTDIDKYNLLWREYAMLDIKVARITNNDNAQKMRCEFENQFVTI